MIAPDWFHFDQAPYGDRDRLTRAEVDGACWLHLRLTVSTTVAGAERSLPSSTTYSNDVTPLNPPAAWNATGPKGTRVCAGKGVPITLATPGVVPAPPSSKEPFHLGCTSNHSLLLLCK